jgi:histidinol-phosphate aminotransferase
MQPHVFEHLRRLPRHPAGQPIPVPQRQPGQEQVVNLGANGNPWGPAEAVRARVLQALDGAGLDRLRSYPAADGPALKAAIAARRGVDPAQVILGNGSSELIAIAARAMLMDGGSGLAAKHSFAPFGHAAQAAGGRFIECMGSLAEAEAEPLLAAAQPDTRIVYVGQPNNPTGTLLDRDALALLTRGLRSDILLVVDQAYAEYEEPETYPDAAAYLEQRANLLVLHSFSKIHALAGLRIGYGLGGTELVSLLERVRDPYNTNCLAQAAAEAAVREEAFEAQCRARVHAARAAFLAEAERHPCRVSGQAGNFLVLETMFPAQALARDLLRAGVLVHPLEQDGLPNHVRVSMGTPDEMAAFWRAAGPLLDNLSCGCY